LGSKFHSENGDRMFLRNFGYLTSDSMLSYPKRRKEKKRKKEDKDKDNFYIRPHITWTSIRVLLITKQ
jgi:hypothetical protein